MPHLGVSLRTRLTLWYGALLALTLLAFASLLYFTLQRNLSSSMDERLEYYLRTQAETLGNPLKITHQQIASDLNTSREVVSRLLKKMENRNKVGLSRNAIEWLG